MPSVTCDKYKTFGIVICTCCLFECSSSAFSPCSGRAQGSGPAGVSAIKLMDRRFTDLCFLPSFNTRSTLEMGDNTILAGTSVAIIGAG